jgi:hypothetical protein
MGEFDVASLSEALALEPSYSHKKGVVGQIQTVFDSDMWSLKAPLDRTLPLEKHLEWLVDQFESRYEILKRIKTYAKIDVFCGITTGEQSGFSLSPKALSIFRDLEINLEVSLILSDESGEDSIEDSAKT